MGELLLGYAAGFITGGLAVAVVVLVLTIRNR